MSFHITLRIAAVFQEFTLVFLFFPSLLLHHSMDLRLAHARHFRHVRFRLVAITLLSCWRQRRPTRRLQTLLHPATPRGDDQAVMPTPRGRRPWNSANHTPVGICHASWRSVDALETSVPLETCLQRHKTHIRIGIGDGIRNAIQIPQEEAFCISFSAQLLQDRWNL